jgi:hypothetical protein
MSKSPKLTVPQADLLCRIAERGGSYHCAEDYAPAKKLVLLGLCDGRRLRFGSYALTLTDAGRAHLEANK